ncbi:hypothetical protein Rhopal_002942-T1 [Rhodotorula paludigena]|uniref:Proteophosphoglycan ppg4 n=1 Tax=Rhodotorula paludigena TaxID=86838 RepID=A0AAV5GIH1_9BASI|nr:hypothetical protein Rhopal_002942-T1 [Rhodotorula paludigena]
MALAAQETLATLLNEKKLTSFIVRVPLAAVSVSEANPRSVEHARLRGDHILVQQLEASLASFADSFDNPFSEIESVPAPDPPAGKKAASAASDKASDLKRQFRPALYPCAAILSPERASSPEQLDELRTRLRSLEAKAAPSSILPLSLKDLRELGLLVEGDAAPVQLVAGQGRYFATDRFWKAAGSPVSTPPYIYTWIYLPEILSDATLLQELVVTSNEDLARRPNDASTYLALTWPISVDAEGKSVVQRRAAELAAEQLISLLEKQNPKDKAVVGALRLLRSGDVRVKFREFVNSSYLAAAEFNAHRDFLSRKLLGAGAAQVALIWMRASLAFARAAEAQFDKNELLLRFDIGKGKWIPDEAHRLLSWVTENVLVPVKVDREPGSGKVTGCRPVFGAESEKYGTGVKLVLADYPAFNKADRKKASSTAGLKSLIADRVKLATISGTGFSKAIEKVCADHPDAVPWGYVLDEKYDLYWQPPLPHLVADLYTKRYNFVVSFVLEKLAKGHNETLRVTNKPMSLADKLVERGKVTSDNVSSLISVAFPPPPEFIQRVLKRLDVGWDELGVQLTHVPKLVAATFTECESTDPYIEGIFAYAPSTFKLEDYVSGPKTRSSMAANKTGGTATSTSSATDKKKAKKLARKALEDKYMLLEAQESRPAKSNEFVATDDDNDSPVDEDSDSEEGDGEEAGSLSDDSDIKIVSFSLPTIDDLDASAADSALDLVEALLGGTDAAGSLGPEQRAALAALVEGTTLVSAREPASFIYRLASTVRRTWSRGTVRRARAHTLVVKREDGDAPEAEAKQPDQIAADPSGKAEQVEHVAEHDAPAPATIDGADEEESPADGDVEEPAASGAGVDIEVEDEAARSTTPAPTSSALATTEPAESSPVVTIRATAPSAAASKAKAGLDEADALLAAFTQDVAGSSEEDDDEGVASNDKEAEEEEDETEAALDKASTPAGRAVPPRAAHLPTLRGKKIAPSTRASPRKTSAASSTGAKGKGAAAKGKGKDGSKAAAAASPATPAANAAGPPAPTNTRRARNGIAGASSAVQRMHGHTSSQWDESSEDDEPPSKRARK